MNEKFEELISVAIEKAMEALNNGENSRDIVGRLSEYVSAYSHWKSIPGTTDSTGDNVTA